jgi:NhaA family Na+:H+ antiporter
MDKPDKKKRRIDETFGNLIKSNTLGGLMLIVFTLIALIWANSPWKDSYHQLWHTPLSVSFGSIKFEMHLLHWINDLLMAVFFYLVGLEIKREIYAGELSSPKKAALPALGALGGMIIPAAIYITFISASGNENAMNGWGIPMATDIAFSLGIISLLGKRVPLALKIFLAAFAIVDDLGAIFVIAIFYTSDLNVMWLLIGLSVIALLFLLNRLKFRIIPFYHIAGIVVWYCFHESGIHATIAGVLLAFTIPISRELGVKKFKKIMNEMQMLETGDSEHTLTEDQISHIHAIENQLARLQSPVQRLEHSMHDIVNYAILPLFVLANSGVTIIGTDNSFSMISIAIAVGLIAGKTIGISLFAWIGCKLGITELPSGIKWNQLIGIAVLGGLGFTMSIFIANLAFTDEVLLGQAKSGILLGSFLSGILGYYILNRLFPAKKLMDKNP